MCGSLLIPAAKGPTLISRLELLAATLVLSVFISPLSLAQSSHPATGAPASYQIELEPGTNLVSLPVVPNNPSVSAIASGILPSLTFVQNEMGEYYVPSQGINDLGRWAGDEAYKIEVSSPATLYVEGAEILPQFSPIALETGGVNWVAYTRREPMAVAEAFASILTSLESIETADRRFYIPGDAGSTLDSLRVGEGYKVRVSQSATLIYPANPGQPNNGSAANTLSEALTLTGLVPGQEIEVLGYHTPGDGGGGTFLVTNGGETPDGGLVFVPYEAQALATEVLPNAQTTRHLSSLPAGQDVIYGSLTLDLLDPVSDDPIFTAADEDLHGVEWLSRYPDNLTLDYETGSLLDRRQRLKQHCNLLTGSGWSCDLRFTYRHTTSDLRLRRLGVGPTLNADWFGARTVDDDPTFDNQPLLNHMINVADRMNVETPGSVTTISLPRLAVYEYFGSIRLSDGLTLKGAGGTELVTVTNDLGHTYSPVRLKPAHTTLRVKSDEALTHIRMLKDPADPFYLEPDVKLVLHNRQSVIYPAPGAESVAMEDLALDGNWQGNQQAWTEGWASNEEKETWMRNAPGWSGFVSTDHNNVPMPIGQLLILRNVAITGFGATNVLGDADNEWIGENVRLGNSLWNHSFYSANGAWTNLTFEGFAWTQAIFTVMEVANLVYEDGAPCSISARPRPCQHPRGRRL